MPDLVLTYSDFSISPNSPSGDLRAAVYTDVQGWMYFVNPSDYRVVEIQPSAIYSSPGPALSDDALRAKARKLAQTYVPGFANMESNLHYEEGRKGDMHFFRWEDRSSPIVHMPPLFQAGLRADGQLITYVNTLGLK